MRGAVDIPKTVLIVDDDLGFVFWLGHVLDAAAYCALPARTVPDAALLVMQLDLTVDVLVINPQLPDGPDFVAALHRSQNNVKVIGILDGSREVAHIPGVNATHPKPLSLDETARTAWIHCIERVLVDSSIQESPI